MTWDEGGVASVHRIDDPSEQGKHCVQGTVICASELDLQRLDRFENHPHTYKRTPVTVVLELPHGNELPVEAMAYVKQNTTFMNPPGDRYINACRLTLADRKKYGGIHIQSESVEVKVYKLQEGKVVLHS
jgi:hypothetical protein